MAAKPASKVYDEGLIAFYLDKVCNEADSVYRFAVAITLSPEGALRCVRAAFEDVATNLEDHYHDENMLATLVAACWRAYDKIKGDGLKGGQSAITKLLKSLDEQARAALAAVDVLGLAPAQAATALGWDEKELRLTLGSARKAIMDVKA